MPWTINDVDKFKKGLNPTQKAAWVNIANGSLKSCLASGKGGSFCEGFAVRLANSKAIGVKENDINIVINANGKVKTTVTQGRFKMADADANMSDLNFEQKKAWVKIANESFTNCKLSNGGDDYCEGYALRTANMEMLSESDKVKEIEWTEKYINSLPDSSFAYVEGDKRYFPFKDKNGKIDLPHLRDALTKAPDSSVGGKAMPRLKAAAKNMKIEEYADDWKGGEGQFRSHTRMSIIKELYDSKPDYKPNESKREVVLPMLKEGWGNPHDKNYYTSKAIAESVSYLQSRRKMYLNHPKADNDERDMRDWAASIQDTWKETLSDGSNISMGRVKIYDNWLWERFKVAPDEIGTSILGRGKSKKDTVDGKDANVIESIEYIRSCDFVDYPGNTPMGMVYFVESERFDKEDKTKKQEETELKIEEITIGMLREGRAELVAQIEQTAVETLNSKITKLETKVKEQDQAQVVLQKKLDDKEVIEKENEKKTLVEQLLSESKLSENAKTDVFKENLVKCEDKDQMLVQIKDREALLGLGESPIKNAGAAKNVKEVDVETQDAFNRDVFGLIKEEEKK